MVLPEDVQSKVYNLLKAGADPTTGTILTVVVATVALPPLLRIDRFVFPFGNINARCGENLSYECSSWCRLPFLPLLPMPQAISSAVVLLAGSGVQIRVRCPT